MGDLTHEKLIEMITAEVIKTLGVHSHDEKKGLSENLPLVLILGGKENLPEKVKMSYSLDDITGYEKNTDISRYERVFITSITPSQLAGAALGISNDSFGCALSDAMLKGINIQMLENAPEHRKSKAQGNRNYYQMFEQYVHILESFGVGVIRTQHFGKAIARDAVEFNTADKVITQDAAERLIKHDGDTIFLQKGTIITPSARDIFNHTDKKIEFR